MLAQDMQRGSRQFTFDCLPDTGSTRVIVSLNVIKREGLRWHKKDNLNLSDASDNKMEVEGIINLYLKPELVNGELNTNGKMKRITALVSSSLEDEIFLSWSDLIKLGVIKSNFPAVETENFITKRTTTKEEVVEDPDVTALKQKYKEVFAESLEGGRHMAGQEMHIYLKDNVDIKPCHISSARAPPLAWQESAMKLVKSLLRARVIEPVDEPLAWCSSSHFVEKPGKNPRDAVRMVTDFTHLNKFVQRPHHGFPTTQEIMNNVKSTSRYFAVIDLVQGYHQIPLDQASSDLTCFMLSTGAGSRR